jgi:hypothetical protein
MEEIKQQDYPLINRYLRELGSSLRLGEEETSAESGTQE